VIYGESLSQSVSTFGFSLSGGKDLDGNQYPDLLVGAYDSDMVAYFRYDTKCVVSVFSSFPLRRDLNDVRLTDVLYILFLFFLHSNYST